MSNGSVVSPATSSSKAGHTFAGGWDREPTASIPRSASYTRLQSDTTLDALPEQRDGLRRSFSENVLTIADDNNEPHLPTTRHDKEDLEPRKSTGYTEAAQRHSSSTASDRKATTTDFMIGGEETGDDDISKPRKALKATSPGRARMRRSVSGSISRLARKSWIITSRSPSPSPNGQRLHKDKSAPPLRPQPKASLKDPNEKASRTSNGPNDSLPRRNSFLTRRSRPLSALLGRDAAPDAPSVPPIPTSFSTDKLPSLGHKRSFLNGAPAVPHSTSFEKLQGSGTEILRRKDDLWSAFRNLDGEYHKFQARPSTTKSAVVRSALLPFLRTYADHPSITNLRPEDLDRRTVILNKWWTGLLEMLNGRRGESVSGNDRPAILEAVTALMIRPEWTLSPVLVSTRQGKTPRASLKSRSTTSLGSTMSDFLVDSVFHNVKNTFTQNLLAQMAYVVDKMSTRNVAASVVAFCGKAAAYAFFYCDGVAEILVRLWALSSETIRRVLIENGVPRGENIGNVSERVSAPFPPCLQSLTFRALRPMMSHLRSRPHLPIATAYIPWHGPWVGRWAGRDTDLFFVFAKFYIDLACRFLTDNTSSVERMAVPGWVLIQAQILTTLDATMQRTNGQASLEQSNAPSSITFDEMFGEADATATMLPLPTNGLVRSMAENRLIMLLRDCLAGSAVIGERTRSIFAESFANLLKATTRRVCLFDHNACFTLCDFLEEAMAILSRYHLSSNSALAILDWSFWLDVFRRMLLSHNSMTEVRLFAFLYSMWNIIVSDEERKRELCLRWLLRKETFQAQFNHWCPMVRAFFMRLLVWKVSRLDSRKSCLDLLVSCPMPREYDITKPSRNILEALSVRLQDTWCYYLYNKQLADAQNLALPSSAPCSPAPSRCLLIIRDDVQPAPNGMLLSFEGILSSSSAVRSNPYEKHSSRDPSSQRTPSDLEPPAPLRNSTPAVGKKRWGLLRNMLPFSSSATDRTATHSHDSISNIPGGTAESRESSSDQKDEKGDGSNVSSQNRPQAVENSQKKDRPSPSPHRSLSFKFSLEWTDKDAGPAGRERKLYAPNLPLPAQLSLQTQPNDSRVFQPRKPEGAAIGPSKYAGRALAEWALLVLECQNFFDRRKAEGVPMYQMVETPTLGVEPFRKN